MSSQSPVAPARYEIGRRLGAGATGVVYEAFDRQRGVLVALKTLRRVDATALRRLKHEFRALSDIVHPNLVTLHELVATDSGCFIIMDLVDGVPFLSWVRADAALVPLAAEPTFSFHDDIAPQALPESTLPQLRALDTLRLREAFRQLAEGITALHLHGRLHRDLKPSNVLVEKSGRVVLLDFGLVALRDEQRADGGPVVGTVGYMSPEQAARLPLTTASDWYAFGTMLFEALTGSRPFSGSVNQVLEDKQHLDPPDPGDLIPDLPADLAALSYALLARDPASRPSGPRILSLFGGATPDLSTSSSFVGRHRELSLLSEAWRKTSKGHPVLAIVRGRSGIGKTALVEHFLSSLDATVLSGRCYERESVPYKALDSVVDALASRYGPQSPSSPDIDAAGVLFPVLRRGGAPLSLPDPNERRAQGFRALLRLLGSLAPLVIVVDDAHWGDADSAMFFGELLAAPFPVLVIMTWRAEEQDQSVFIRTLMMGDIDPVEISVEQLPHEDSCALARSLLPRAGEQTIEAIAAASGGHPLFVQEIIRARRLGIENPGGGALDDAIRARATTLPDTAQRLLEVIALAGRQTLARTLGVVMDADIVPDIGVLRAARLVRTRTAGAATEVEPYHDRVREAIVAGLSAERTVALHRALAVALSLDPEAPPSALATHWFGAGEPEKALPCALSAAEIAESALAFDHASALWRLALSASRDPVQRRHYTERLARTLSAAGRPAEAADVWLSLEDLPTSLRCLAAEQLIAAGHVARGLSVLSTAAEKSQITIPRTPVGMVADIALRKGWQALRGRRWVPRREPLDDLQRARLDVCWAAVDGLTYIEPLQMSVYHARHLALALGSGDPRAVARALVTEASSLAFVGGSSAWGSAQKVLDEAGRAVALAGDDELLGLLRYGTAMLAYHQHRFDEAYQIAVECEQLFLERSAYAAWHLARTRMLQCWCHLWRGRMLAISDLVPRIVRDAQERGNVYLATSALTDIGYILGMIDDTPAETLQALDEREESWSKTSSGVPGLHLQHLNIAMARVQIRAYQGDLEGAYATATDLERRWQRSVLSRGHMFRGLVLHLTARAALGLAEREPSRTDLLRQVRRALPALARLELPHVRGAVAGLMGRLAFLSGDPLLGAQHLREAIVGLDGAGILLLAHAYRRYLGERLGGEEGAGLVARAEAWMNEQGVRRSDRFTSGILLCP